MSSSTFCARCARGSGSTAPARRYRAYTTTKNQTNCSELKTTGLQTLLPDECLELLRDDLVTAPCQMHRLQEEHMGARRAECRQHVDPGHADRRQRRVESRA